MKRVQSVKSLSLMSSKPMGLLVFGVGNAFSFADMILRRVNPVFLTINSDAVRFFLYQKFEDSIVHHHWHKHILNLTSYNNYNSRSILSEVECIGNNNGNQRLNYLGVPPQERWNEKNTLESETLIPNVTILKPLFTSFSKNIFKKTSTRFYPSSMGMHMKINSLQYNNSSHMHSHAGAMGTSQTTHLTHYDSRSILSEVERIGNNNENQQLNSLSIPPQERWNEKNTLESDTLVPNITILKPLFTSFSTNIFKKNSTRSHPSSVGMYTKIKSLQDNTSSHMHSHAGAMGTSQTTHLTHYDSRSILSEVERIGNNNENQQLNSLNILPQERWNEKHMHSHAGAMVTSHNHNMLTTTELNYNRIDNTTVEITYKKENIKQEEQNSNSYSNINSPITIKNGVEVIGSHEEKIESLINNVEQRVIQRVSSDVMAKVEAKWSREIMRRGGDYGR